MKHIMIDLETLGNHSDAAIIQIGAVVFDLEQLGESFKATIDIEDAMRHGKVTASTLKWWMQQSEDARQSVMSGTEKLSDALERLNEFVKKIGGKKQFWSHATFDFPILSNAFKATGKQNAIQFRECRDLRTLESFYGDRIGWYAREGIHHDALADCIFQAMNTQLMLRVANVGSRPEEV